MNGRLKKERQGRVFDQRSQDSCVKEGESRGT